MQTEEEVPEVAHDVFCREVAGKRATFEPSVYIGSATVRITDHCCCSHFAVRAAVVTAAAVYIFIRRPHQHRPAAAAAAAAAAIDYSQLIHRTRHGVPVTSATARQPWRRHDELSETSTTATGCRYW